MPILLGWRSLILFPLVPAWLITGASAETGQPLFRFAHPNAKSLVGIEVSRFRQSRLLQSFEKTWLQTAGRALPGMELLGQVDQVFISSPGNANPDDALEPPVLVMVKGRFNPAQVRQLLRKHGAKPQLFGDITVYRAPANAATDFCVTVLDAATILGGDAQSIFASIERMRVPAALPSNGLLARAEAFKSDYDFWALMTDPSGLTSPRLPLAALANSGLFQGVNGIELGVSLRDGLALTGSLVTPNDQNARVLKDEFNKLLKLAVKDRAAQPDFARMAKKLKLDLDGSAVRFSVLLSKQDLDDGFRKLQAAHRSTETVLVEPKPIIPDKPQVIRIEGLDEGPREIKVTP